MTQRTAEQIIAGSIDNSWGAGAAKYMTAHILKSLAAAGYAVVPREPTMEMMAAAEFGPDRRSITAQIRADWNAMLDAADAEMKRRLTTDTAPGAGGR